MTGDDRRDPGPAEAHELFERLRRLPPVERDPLPTGWGASAPDGPRPPSPPAGTPGHYYVPAGAEGSSPAPPSAPPSVRPSPSVPPPSAPPPRRPAGAPRRPPAGRRTSPARRVALVAVFVLGAFVLALLGFGIVQYLRLDRVAVGDALSAPGGGGTNYLIVGSDSRVGFDPSDPNAGAVLGDGAGADDSERTDTLLVLRVERDGARMMSIPRDLWVTRADGSTGRINAAIQRGPDNLVRTVRGSLGIPVHRYVEVDFVTFAGLVDAVGGVPIEIPYPAQDPASGLDLPTAGRVELDGVQALAFVRSRGYRELVDGRWVTDPTGDLGRVQRQQQFLRAVLGEVASTRHPVELVRVGSAAAGGLRVDDRMGLLDTVRFATQMRGLDPVSEVLPVRGRTTSGGAAVLDLVQPDAGVVLARMGATAASP